MQIIPLILLSVSVLLLVLGVFLWFLEVYEKWTSPLSAHYKINCSKTHLAKTIIRWGLINIRPSGKKESVNFKIYYHLNKKKLGVFYGSRKEIVLYVNNHQQVQELIDTSLHEVIHYKQYLSNPKSFEKEYHQLLSSIGYQHHPMEEEARKLAAEYAPACLEYLLAQNVIIKQ